MYARANISTKKEIRDIIIADAVLIIAFSFVLMGGVSNFSAQVGNVSKELGLKGVNSPFTLIIYLIPLVAVGVTLSFVLHELMHKFVAQHYGAIAGFQMSTTGLLITFLTGFFGFLFGIPGATVIYTSNFTKKENGIVSIAGPLTNFAVFGVFLSVYLIFGNSLGSYISYGISLTLFISILLAFFNMLPIFPLDGSKVLAWNKPIYITTMGIIFILMMVFTPIPYYIILFMLVIAVMFSLFYRNVL
ncbi:site-2 protease family protein [Candidatus Marsarchaeota archaeon]|jgi:Zn-dependent protease|nr:site-2 protease family protein [Candidatus Marsarchaeota archaeon]MCL5089972.1 site-2 protease family protein [Candidatus Marsarchaeota archaeon]